MKDNPSNENIHLSLCMIVRDSTQTLAPCLESIRPWVDEMVVIDTGSKDDTRALAASYGARVLEFPWCNDFSAARNESIRHARGRWLFWMDSDDTIDEVHGQRLRDLAFSYHKERTLGYVMQVHCPGTHSDSDVTIVDHIKMFRNLEPIRFEFRIHEQLLPSIRRLDGEVEWTNIGIRHSGSDRTREGRCKKQERDLHLLELELMDRPDHPFALFNMGMTLADIGRHDQAIEYLRRCLHVSGTNESHLRKAYAILVGSLGQVGRLQDALSICAQGLSCCPDDPELLFRQGLIAHKLKHLALAETAYKGALRPLGQNFFASRDAGITGYKARHNLALVYADMGRQDLAELQWREAVATMTAHRDGWMALGQCLITQKKYATVEVEAQRLCLAEDHLKSVGHLLLAQLQEAKGGANGASEQYEQAASQFPEDIDVLGSAARFFFESNQPEKALPYQRALVSAVPEDPAAQHNLGCLYLQLGCPQEAVGCLTQSLHLRADSPETRRQLEIATRALQQANA